MRIIIGGAGEVGVHLAKLLSKENYSIVIVDENEEVLNNLNSNYDLMTIIGSPTSIASLKEAGCASADLFIGVTPDESRNLIACYIAKNLGVRKTVARVENGEYVEERYKGYFSVMGVDTLICPEILAAEEIAQSVKRPWVRQYYEFDNGALVLLGVKIREGAPIVGKQLMEIFSPNETSRIAVIQRGRETIIPGGRDMVLADDMVYFVTTPEHIETVRVIAGKPLEDVSNVMIMGGSRIAVLAAEEISKELNVKIIESDLRRAEIIKERLRDKVMVIHGDGRDADLLKDEGIQYTQAYIALTANAETNILACLAAKRWNILRTIAQVEKLDYIPLAESADIGIVINKKLIAASRIFRMLLAADVTNMKCLTYAEANVAEFIVKDDSKITRRTVKDLRLPEKVSIGGIIRDGQGIVVYGNTQILAGDRVLVFCETASLHKMERFFN